MDQKTFKIVLEAVLTKVLANHPTKADIKNLITKDDLKQALAHHPTKDDMKYYPTKDDLKQALAHHPTKDDMKYYPTKDDLKQTFEKQRETISEDFGEVINTLFTKTDELKANKTTVEALEKRITKLEHN